MILRLIYPQKGYFWAAIINHIIFDEFFIEDNPIARKYEAMVRDEIVSAIQEIAGDGIPKYVVSRRRCCPTVCG